MNKIICLLTDFGLQDGYVAAMKAVILGIDNSIQIIDLSHQVSSFDTQTAGWLLNTNFKFFPKNTIFISVVDPDVGTDRKIILVKTPSYYFIAPDNGILSYVLNSEPVEEVISIINKKYFLPEVSNTFHGRDIFAPVGAYLAKNPSIINELGDKINIHDLFQFKVPSPSYYENKIEAEIIYIDKFGNLTTNIPSKILEGKRFKVQVGNYLLDSVAKTYTQSALGDLLLITGSNGYIEISACMANAQKITQFSLNQKLIVDLCK